VFRRIIWKEFRPIPNGPALLDINSEENLDRSWNLCRVIQGQALFHSVYNTTTVS